MSAREGAALRQRVPCMHRRPSRGDHAPAQLLQHSGREPPRRGPLGYSRHSGAWHAPHPALKISELVNAIVPSQHITAPAWAGEVVEAQLESAIAPDALSQMHRPVAIASAPGSRAASDRLSLGEHPHSHASGANRFARLGVAPVPAHDSASAGEGLESRGALPSGADRPPRTWMHAPRRPKSQNSEDTGISIPSPSRLAVVASSAPGWVAALPCPCCCVAAPVIETAGERATPRLFAQARRAFGGIYEELCIVCKGPAGPRGLVRDGAVGGASRAV